MFVLLLIIFMVTSFVLVKVFTTISRSAWVPVKTGMSIGTRRM